MPSRRITSRSLRRGLRRLTAADPDLAALVAAHGPPPLWAREPGFPTLVRIVLEQQVSLASARAAFARLEAAASPLSPGAFLALDDGELRAIGFSRQKAGYCRDLARGIESGEVDLEALEQASDREAGERLLALRGVGPWTADIYLLMALGRSDVWPRGDLALDKALREVKGLGAGIGGDELAAVAGPWRPWRAVAARLLWHHYLETRANGGGP